MNMLWVNVDLKILVTRYCQYLQFSRRFLSAINHVLFTVLVDEFGQVFNFSSVFSLHTDIRSSRCDCIGEKCCSIRTSVCYRAVTQRFVVYSIKQDSLNQY